MATGWTCKMISARVSPMVELARWLFERHGVPYSEEAHAPMLHLIPTLAVGGGVEVPVVVTPDGKWKGAKETLAGIDALSAPGARLFGETEAERAANQAIIDRLLTLLLKNVRRHLYHALLPNKRILYPVATEGAPAWERAFVYWLYPVWRLLMSAGLGFAPRQLQEAPVKILEAIDLAESELKRRGSAFLNGTKPGVLDIVFSALVAPVVFPANYGAKLPPLAELPAPLANFIRSVRQRPAGDLVLRTYAAAR